MLLTKRYMPFRLAPLLSRLLPPLLLPLVSAAPYAAADDTTVAVAANFKAAMERLVAGFEQDSDHTVAVAYGSSGKLYAQIRQGAPFDAFLSADTAKPDALVEDQRVVAGSRFTYAVGQLVLWSRDEPRIPGPVWLKDGDYGRLALANPRFAPYGAAAEQTLGRLGLLDSRSRWVRGENIAQTYQFVATGNAEAGFVARSQLGAQLPSSVWIVPPELHDPITQDLVLLKRGAENRAARNFLRYMRSESAARIIQASGYGLPGDS